MYLKEPKSVQLRTSLFHPHVKPSSLKATTSSFFLILTEMLSIHRGLIQYTHSVRAAMFKFSFLHKQEYILCSLFFQI